jgi:hypothetical protein
MSKDGVSELENKKALFSDALCDYRYRNRIIAVHKSSDALLMENYCQTTEFASTRIYATEHRRLL